MKSRQRRMKGEGSITKMPSGKYRVRLEVSPSPLGKRQWLTAVVGTQKEATSKLQEFQRQKKTEDMVEKLKESFSDFIEPYLTYKASEGLLPSTLYRIRQTLKETGDNYFPNIPVQKISSELLQEIVKMWRDDKGNKETTIRVKYKIIQGYFDWLRQKKYIAKSPFDETILKRQKKKNNNKLIIISQEEHEKLKTVMEKYWDPEDTNGKLRLRNIFLAIYLLTYETGMREGEVAGLKVKCVDTETATITVENSLSFVNGELIDNPPKTAAGFREIVISRKTLGYLKDLMSDNEEDYVFRNPVSGKPFNPASLLARFQQFQKEAGIDHAIKFHTIRHTNASILIAKGVPTPVITERLGHSSVGITYNTYAHALRDSKERKEALVEA